MDMSWIESSLSRLEHQLRELFEGNHPADGISRKLHHQLEHALFSALRASLGTSAAESWDGRKFAPDEYTLLLPPQLAEQLLTHPQELDRLALYLIGASAQAGYPIPGAPVLHVVADPQAEQVKVVTASSHQSIGHTGTAAINGQKTTANPASVVASVPSFLIINGLSTYPLNGVVVNIGRDPSNHVCIDDPRVSRQHAQIRLVQGRYIIFDLDSDGGTAVNGIHASSHVLNPGDVISLAGVPMVFGQELGLQHDYTQEVPPIPQPPVIL
jgi:hypothetical protein